MEDNLGKLLDDHVRQRINKIVRVRPDYFSGKLVMADILPYVKPIMPPTSWEELTCTASIKGNTSSIRALTDLGPRYNEFGSNFLWGLVETGHKDVAQELVQDLDPRAWRLAWSLPLTEKIRSLRELRPIPEADPPPYSASVSTTSPVDDQEQKLRNFSSQLSDVRLCERNGSGPVDNILFYSQISSATISSHPSERLSTPLSDRFNAMRMNIVSSDSRQPSDANSDDTSGDSPSVAVGNTLALEQIPVSATTLNDLNTTNVSQVDESQGESMMQDDVLSTGAGQNLTPQRQQTDTNLATVAETTVNLPNVTTGKVQNAVNHATTQPVNMVRPSGDVSEKADSSHHPSSLCVSEDSDSLTERCAFQSETTPKEIAVFSASPSLIPDHQHDPTSDYSELDDIIL